MKQNRQNRFKIPIFSWLFFLFLSAGNSCFEKNQYAGESVFIERVDLSILGSGQKNRIALYSPNLLQAQTIQLSEHYFLRINLLSQKLDRLVQIALSRQSSLSPFIPENIIPHFRSRSLVSDYSGDHSDLIS